MKRIKVLQITSNLHSAGAERIMTDLSINLNKNKFEVLVCVLYKKENTLLEREIFRNKIKTIFLNKHIGFDPKIISKLNKIMKDFSPDIIHAHKDSHLKYFLYSAILNKTKAIVTIHNQMEKNTGWFNYILFKYLISIFGIHTVYLSNSLRPFSLRNKKSYLISNGINVNRFLAVAEERILENQKVILNIGRLEEQKNQTFLLKAFSTILKKEANAKLVILGSGKLKTKLELLAEKLNIDKKVVFAGHQNNVIPYIQRANLCVSTSLWEGMPITILEQMASKRVTLSSRVGAASDLLIDNKLLYDSQNMSEFVKKAIYLLNNNKVRKKIAAKLQDRASCYSVERMVNNYEKIYLKIANSK